MKTLKIFAVLLVTVFLGSCALNPFNRYRETESGIQYRFHNDVKDSRAPEVGNLVSLQMVYRDSKDSVLMDTRIMGMPFVLELIDSQYPGDIYEAITMMTVGDSASFKIDAEQFFTQTAGAPALPEFIEVGSKLTFDILMINVFTPEEYQAEQLRLAEEQRAKNAELEKEEMSKLEAYLLGQNISEAARESGLIYIETLRGTGVIAGAGKTVSVHYEGRLLDGTVFDSSLERGTPIDFVLGQGQVIPGWDEGISLMRKGGKAQLIIPSHLAYGEYGAPDKIPPFSTLIFDVELVDVK